MPGLLRGVARTAVVAGTATAVSNRVSRRQANRWSAQQEPQYQEAPPQYQQAPPQYQQAPPPPQYVQAAPPPAAAAPVDRIGALKDLAELRDSGALTEAEFETEKARILAS